jgi:hypothetical protein
MELILQVGMGLLPRALAHLKTETHVKFENIGRITVKKSFAAEILCAQKNRENEQRAEAGVSVTEFRRLRA